MGKTGETSDNAILGEGRNMRITHRGSETVGEALIHRLQSIILSGATLVAVKGDESLYSTPSGRFFVVAGDNLRPVTKDEAEGFRGES